MAPPRSTLARVLPLAALLALLLLAAAAVWLGGGFGGRTEQGAADAEPAQALEAALARVVRRPAEALQGVAVRPLAAAASAGSAQIAGGLCETLTLPLVRAAPMRVVPCSATRQPVAAALDDTRLARLLAVSHVISGSVEALPGGERLRVRLVLQQPGAVKPLAWQLDEEMPLAGLQTLPARVADATGRALGHAPLPQPRQAGLPDAVYPLYMRAVELGRRESIADRRAALALFTQVLAAAPDHGPTLHNHLTVRQRLAGNADPDAPPLTVEQAQAAREARRAEGLALAQRLLAADPDDLRATWLLLSDEIYTRRWPAALDRLDAILQRHPLLPGYSAVAARIHLHAGYLERARALALAALQINALDHEALEVLALVAGMRGEDTLHREALELARQVGHSGLGYSSVIEAWRRRDWPEVERRLTAWVAWGGKWSAAWVPQVVRGMAEPAARDAAVALLDGHDAATRRHFASYFIEYALLGAHEQALKAVRYHGTLPPAVWMQWLWWPELTPARREAGFVDAMRELGVVDLWEQRGAPELCQRGPAGWRCN